MRLWAKIHTDWLRWTYPFASFGRRVTIPSSCDIHRKAAPYILIEDDVYLGEDVWLNIADLTPVQEPKLVISKSCKVGRRSTISARNSVILEEDVLTAPGVLIMDHNHEYNNPDRPIHAQGVTDGGTIRIGKNSWLGYGAVIFCASGNLTIGRNSVVGAHSIVTKSVPAYSVVAGNPARLLKQYDPASSSWVKVDHRSQEKS